MGQHAEEREADSHGYGLARPPRSPSPEAIAKLTVASQTQHIQEALAACGWKEAALLEQQDTSEAFAFITETLQLPLLALQVDLFHHGKRDADDHKVVHERLLNLAVPPDPEGKGIKLEDCLEEYFNTRVDVLRDSLDEKKGPDRPSLSPKATIRVVTDDDAETPQTPSENGNLERRWTTHGVVQPPVSVVSPSPAALDGPSTSRTRSTSIIQRIVVDGEHSAGEDPTSLPHQAKRSGSTVVKAVTIPAWQFFRLIRECSRRPVIMYCLLRCIQRGTPPRTANPTATWR